MTDALMVSSSFLPGRGGIESYLAELCAELSPRLAVLAPNEREGRTIPQDLGYETFGYPGSMLLPSKRVANAVVERCRALGTNKVLFGTPWPLVLIGPRLRAAGLRYGVIVHGAEMLVPSVVPIVNRRLARALSQADLLLPVSEFTGRKLSAFLESGRLRMPPSDVLRAAVDLQRFHPEADDGTARARFGLGDGPLLLCFGRLVKRKGVGRALEALEAIERRFPGATLAVAGTGPEMKRLRKQAAGSDARIEFLGRVPDEDAAALYATADVFLLPVVDRYRGLEVEGLGVVLLEAGACGTPSVTGRSGGTPEAVLDGKTGFVVDARDRDELVDAVTRLLENSEHRSEMGRAARLHVEKEFSNDRAPTLLLDWLGDVG
jgi:phosphatidylinositol alpha-1,6-mannosyltransferase